MEAQLIWSDHLKMSNPLGRFSTRDTQHSVVDDKHFSIHKEIEISKQFPRWLLGRGKIAKILYPNNMV